MPSLSSRPIVPLAMVKKMEKKYPDLWRKMDGVRRIAMCSAPWNPKCVVPVNEISSVIVRCASLEDIISGNLITEAQVLYSWRCDKQVLLIKEDFGKFLIEGAKCSGNVKIPVQAITKFPYRSVYVDFYGWLYLDRYVGFFVNFDSPRVDITAKKRKFEVMITLVDKNGATMTMPMLIDDKTTIEESQRYYEMISAKARATTLDEDAVEELTKYANELMQIVLYICSVNAEITENPYQKKVYRANAKKTANNKRCTVRQWDLGLKLGKAIKMSKIREQSKKQNDAIDEEIDTNSTNGSSKRPHVRRAHFHHYWVGTGNERHLELRFLDTMYVNIDDISETDEKLAPVVHGVEQ